MKKILLSVATALTLSVPVQSMAATYNINETLNGGFSFANMVGDATNGSGTMLHHLVDTVDGHTLDTTFNFTSVGGVLSAIGGGGSFSEAFVGGNSTYGTFAFTGLSAAGFTGTFNVLGGFGLYAGAIGSGTVYGSDNFSAGTSTHTSIGNFTTPVPEPETYGMMVMGLGLMGFIARRRKSNQA